MEEVEILYHLPFLPPKHTAWEAVSQEITALQRRFGGQLIYVNPNITSPLYLPRLLFGFHLLPWIRRQERNVRLHHFYNADPFPFPYLRFLRRPVVYSLTGGVEASVAGGFFRSMAAVTVSDESSLERLRRQGIERVFQVRPGIDTQRFTHHPLPLRREFRLMVGSAPWSHTQFTSKGVDALLSVAAADPTLHLVFLWRDVLVEEMETRIKKAGVEAQVTLLNRVVDVNGVLASVHAAIVLAQRSDIVKAYPHSLMESLTAGKPILISRAIPMARFVESRGCGIVVETVSPPDLLSALERLRSRYNLYRQAAERIGPETFSLERMVASFGEVYRTVGLAPPA